MKVEMEKLAETEEVKEIFLSQSLWRNWHIASLLVAVGISFIGFGLVAPLRTLYARDEGASAGEIGIMTSAFMFSGFIFLFPFGWLSDRVNRVVIINCGLFAHMLITLFYLPASSGEVFIGIRLLEGISSAAVLPPARALLADIVPPGRNGEVFGLFSATMFFGIFGGPIVGAFLADRFGYTLVYILSSLFFLPAILMICFAFRGYLPKHNNQQGGRLKSVSNSKLLTSPIVVGCLLRGAISLAPSLGMSVWSLYLIDLGYSLLDIGWTLTLYAIPGILVASRIGRFSDRHRRMPLMCSGGMLLGIVLICYSVFTSIWLLLLLSLLEGLLEVTVRSTNDGYLADHTPLDRRGQAQGLFNAVTEFSSLVGALCAGFLYEVSPAIPFIVLGIAQLTLVLLSAAAALVISRKRGPSYPIV
jgi:MFS family permease